MPEDLILTAGLKSVDAVKLQNFTQDGARSHELTPETFPYLADIAKKNNVTFFQYHFL